MTSKWLNSEWSSPDYQNEKKLNFDILSTYLTSSPKTVLDIGCGLAWESRLLNQHYGSELWLIDGDKNDNDTKVKHASEVNWHDDVNEFLYYHPLSLLDEELKKLGTKNYHLIDCNNISIPENIKFDLITSWLSCGFHYPVSTYRELILKHSHPDTKIIMDLRMLHKKTREVHIEEGVEIVKVLQQGRKHVLAEIKFI